MSEKVKIGKKNKIFLLVGTVYMPRTFDHKEKIKSNLNDCKFEIIKIKKY